MWRRRAESTFLFPTYLGRSKETLLAGYTFLGFAWKFSGDTKFWYFVFTVLSFGLASAPFIFIKCLKPLEKYWRIHGISVAIFLDDGWLIEADQFSCAALAVCVRSDLYKAGFITNDEESHWTPCQVIEWLGIVWDSSHGTIRISDRRLSSIAGCVRSMSQNILMYLPGN